MEGSLPNTSVPVGSSSFQKIASSVGRRIFVIVFLCMVVSGLVYLVAHTMSYNRIVVFNQLTSSSVRLASVHIKDPGFVVIFMQTEGGWAPVGMSWYLPAGHYTNMVIDIGLHQEIYPEFKDKHIGNFVPRNFVARLYKDGGKLYTYDDDSSDVPVKDASGSKVYQKRFWFRPAGSEISSFFSQLWDNPLGFGFDAMWPY